MRSSFLQQLNFSEDIVLENSLVTHLTEIIPAATGVVKSVTSDDRNGTDYWIQRENHLPPISVDVKHRSFDPLIKFGTDDACIETTSVYTGEPNGKWKDDHRAKVGWTLDESKRTDLIIYTWPATDTDRRYWILYFPLLCRASQLHWRTWAEQYGEKPAQNETYLTLSIYPPRTVIEAAIKELQQLRYHPHHRRPLEPPAQPALSEGVEGSLSGAIGHDPLLLSPTSNLYQQFSQPVCRLPTVALYLYEYSSARDNTATDCPMVGRTWLWSVPRPPG